VNTHCGGHHAASNAIAIEPMDTYRWAFPLTPLHRRWSCRFGATRSAVAGIRRRRGHHAAAPRAELGAPLADAAADPCAGHAHPGRPSVEVGPMRVKRARTPTNDDADLHCSAVWITVLYVADGAGGRRPEPADGAVEVRYGQCVMPTRAGRDGGAREGQVMD
jgi:hypothetical protein